MNDCAEKSRKITSLLPALNKCKVKLYSDPPQACQTNSSPLPAHHQFMAQSSTMGPPLSPRETRRSGRRSAPSASASTSKSPDSPASECLPRTKEPITRPAILSNSNNNRTKRLKQEDPEEPVPTKNAHTNGANSSHGNSNGRAKRKANGKEKNSTSTDQLIESASTKLSNSNTGSAADPQDDDPEEQGITRCICGQNGMLSSTMYRLLSYLFNRRRC